MRIKASALGLSAQEYANDQVLDDADPLPTGTFVLPADFWETHGGDMECQQDGEFARYRINGQLARRSSSSISSSCTSRSSEVSVPGLITQSRCSREEKQHESETVWYFFADQARVTFCLIYCIL